MWSVYPSKAKGFNAFVPLFVEVDVFEDQEIKSIYGKVAEVKGTVFAWCGAELWQPHSISSCG